MIGFKKKLGPISAYALVRHFNVSLQGLHRVLLFLDEQGAIVRVQQKLNQQESDYLLAHEFTDQDLGRLIKDYLKIDEISQNFDVKSLLADIKE